MKTKITSLLAITLAATTFFSCSNEIETPENGQMLNPGDAQISIGLGNGATTYSTIALEKIIKNGSGKLFKTDGSEITMTNPKIATAGGVNKFTATVPSGSFAEGEAAKLYLYVNGAPSTTVTTGTAEEKFAASTVSTAIDRELTNGLPAGFGPTSVTLKSGIITTPVALKRAAARVGAVTTSSSITGYTVTLNNVNTTSGAIFTPIAIAANNEVKRILDGVTADMFNATETVGYVYPSTGSTVTVTPISGTPLTVPFAPKAGKNYTVKITPSGNDGVFDGDVTIEEWDATDGDVNADFNTKFAEIKIIGTAAGIFEAHPTAKNTVTVKAGQNLDNFDFSDVVNAPTNSQIKTIALVSSYADASPLEITPITGNLVKIVTASNYTGPEVSQILKITFINNDGVTETSAFTTVSLLAGSAVISDYIKEISIPFNGLTWMPFGTSGNNVTDQATAKAIYETAGSTIAEKLVAYAYTSESNFKNAQGYFFAVTNAGGHCPDGYRIAKLADFKTLTGVDVPKRGTGAPSPLTDKWLKTGLDSQTFSSSVLSRVLRTPIITGGMNFYYQFTANNTVFPFIGTGYNGPAGTNNLLDLQLDGYSYVTNEMRGQLYERVAPFFDGWANNEAAAISEGEIVTANIRCVVEVKP